MDLRCSQQPVVQVKDANGNIVTTSNATITLAITSGTGTAGAQLTCSSDPLSASSGVATFANCAIDKAGNNYTLTATSSGLGNGVSTTFNVTVGPAAQLAFTTQHPRRQCGSTGGVALPTQPVVAVEDLGGNIVTSSSASITLATFPRFGPRAC